MKNIWILNHYATNMFFDKGGRHYWFAKFLIKKGYKVKIFCASSVHKSEQNLIDSNAKYLEKKVNNIEFIFVKVRTSNGNKKDRILSMIDYYRNLKKISVDFKKPDIIIGSSVHPLACILAIKLSKKYKCKNIIEIRDLWPSALIEYGIIKENNILAKMLYAGEHWIYKKSDALVFTMEGGKQYIKDKNWDKDINLNKIFHINNGVDLEEFDTNKRIYKIEDKDLVDKKKYKIIYTGSISLANDVGKIVKVAERLKEKKVENIKILVYGSGTEKERLENYCEENELNNIIFKGKVEKKYIPTILSKGDLNLINGRTSNRGKYGLSLNKSFEYLASGKPILLDRISNYDYIEVNGAGKAINGSDLDSYMLELIKFSKLSKEEYKKYCINSRKTAEQYDFKILTNKLIDIIEKF